MRFKLVFLDFKYHISFPGNFTVYKWCVTKVAHCNRVCNVIYNRTNDSKIYSPTTLSILSWTEVFITGHAMLYIIE